MNDSAPGYDADMDKTGFNSNYTEKRVSPTYDVEGTRTLKGIKLNRIGPALSGPTISADSDSDIDVQKQIEAEEGNSIKYRTCSWQKVGGIHRASMRRTQIARRTEY